MKNPNTIARPGARYRHFKDVLVTVQSVAVHADSGELLVIYTIDGADGTVWARSRQKFEDGRYTRVEE